MAISVENALKGMSVLWTAPTYKQVLVGWYETMKACSDLLKAKMVLPNKAEQTVLFPNGGRIYYVSLEDPDNARGYTADGIVIDEAGDISDYAWDDVLSPMLMDTGGWMWAIGTPRGRTKFWEEHEQSKIAWRDFAEGKRSTIPDSRNWVVPTVGADIIYDDKTGVPILVRKPHGYENPYIKWEEIERLFGKMTSRTFEQEVLARFKDNAEGVFLNFRENAVQKGDITNKEPNEHGVYQMGVDVATIRDYTVISIFDLITGKQVFYKRFNSRGWQSVYDAVEKNAKHYQAQVFMDATGVGDPAYDELSRRGISITPIKFNNNLKRDMVEHCAALVEHKKIKFLDHVQQTFEFEAFQYDKTPMGAVKMNAPVGKNDDCVTAGMLAVWQYQPELVEHSPSSILLRAKDPNLSTFAYNFASSRNNYRNSW